MAIGAASSEGNLPTVDGVRCARAQTVGVGIVRAQTVQVVGVSRRLVKLLKSAEAATEHAAAALGTATYSQPLHHLRSQC